MIEVEVIGVRLELPNNQPIVLLRELGGTRHVPIWIGVAEATAIAMAQDGVIPPRPQTHDLLIDVLEACGRRLADVRVTNVADGVFYAQLTLDDATVVAARASDAIALALRAEVRIYCASSVLDEAGVFLEESDDDEDSVAVAGGQDGDTPSAAEREQQLRRFREFLDHVDPEDFDS